MCKLMLGLNIYIAELYSYGWVNTKYFKLNNNAPPTILTIHPWFPALHPSSPTGIVSSATILLVGSTASCVPACAEALCVCTLVTHSYACASASGSWDGKFPTDFALPIMGHKKQWSPPTRRQRLMKRTQRCVEGQ